ncbi:heat shock 70 kDa 4 [Pelobates cultripes]|uniref:Heat shock 70 kDa 4 n=1 Tax=Pelobates cultripes TaxID=61616 RepID=A0AAD1R3M9_PELCU|nr:heat shock 70 kDa 4 [Pelobates cultripes]
MMMQDKLEKERNDAKNAVEEYVYEMRDKLCSIYENFVNEDDRNSFILKLEDTENWLYEDGEDQAKQVYIDKLNDRKNLGQPIQTRYQEFEEQPKPFEELGKQIQLYMKMIHSFKNKEEAYEHLDPAEVEKVEKSVNESMEWMNNKMNLQHKQNLTVDPVVKTKELTFTCNPIVTKPKPKVEPPKDEQQASEQNGPVDSNTNSQGPQAAEQSSDTAASDAEKQLPEMDIE